MRAILNSKKAVRTRLRTAFQLDQAAFFLPVSMIAVREHKSSSMG